MLATHVSGEALTRQPGAVDAALLATYIAGGC